MLIYQYLINPKSIVYLQYNQEICQDCPCRVLNYLLPGLKTGEENIRNVYDLGTFENVITLIILSRHLTNFRNTHQYEKYTYLLK